MAEPSARNSGLLTTLNLFLTSLIYSFNSSASILFTSFAVPKGTVDFSTIIL